MAGQPMKRAHWELIKPHRDSVFERIENGDSLASIAADLEVRRRFLVDWLELPHNVADYARSRVRAATALAESTKDIADDDAGKDSTDRIMRAKLKIATRQWLARHWDRSGYGEQPTHSTVVNLAQIHADVVRRRSAEIAQTAQIAGAPLASTESAADTDEQ